MKKKEFMKNEAGFTLIEMVGVLAVIAILAALVAPKIFEVIVDSKATRFAGEVNTYKTAVTRWYKDMGTLAIYAADGTTLDTSEAKFETSLTTNGGTTTTTGAWAKWNGPYIDTVKNISIGTAMTISTNVGIATPAVGEGQSWDLNDDGTGDMATTNQVVSMIVTGITQSEFEKVDGIIDSGLDSTAANIIKRGKVKYNSATSIMYIYLAHN